VVTADRCMAGVTQSRTEGCAGGVTRPWTCGGTCAWDPPAITCEEASRILTVGDAVGATTSRDFTQLDETIKRLTASSVPCSISTISDTHFLYVEVRNPNATPAKVEIGIKSVAGQPVADVLVAAYATLPDATAAARKTCLTGAELSCNSDLSYRACLFGTKAPTIPANGSIWIYVGNFSVADAANMFTLSAKITAL
jgi:hypothetical protein